MKKMNNSSTFEFIEESRFDALKLKAEHLYDITK